MNNFFAAVCGSFAIAAVPAPLMAQSPQLIFLEGQCISLVLPNAKDVTSSCVNKVVNSLPDNGRFGFTFVTEPGVAITFSGVRARQATEGAMVTQPIDVIFFGSPQGKSEQIAAVGGCRYEMAFSRGFPIVCRASSSKGSFVAELLVTSDQFQSAPTSAEPAVSMPPKANNGGGLPFRDGKYVTKTSYCAASAENEDFSPIIEINKSGKRFVGYEFDCSVRNVKATTGKLNFDGVCEAEGETEIRKFKMSAVTEKSFTLGGKKYTACGG